MRTMYILRGAPGSGKSTWVKDNNLEPYTLSADSIRLMYQGPVLNEEGSFVISQNNDSRVWKMLYELLEQRMAKGEFVVVDATHYKSNLLNKYKKLISDYRYRAYVVDFTKVPLETMLERNAKRDAYKYVPENVIRKMCAVFENDTEVSSRFNIITPDEAVAKLSENMVFDYNRYAKIVVFGDIHGCYEPLKAYFEGNPFDENTAYIFVGDFLDRGIQNKEVLEFMMSLKDKKNVLMLEGNHEQWIRMYADESGAEILMNQEDERVLKKYVDGDFFRKFNMNKIRNRGFIAKTIPQIADINKKDLRRFCRKFGQMAYVAFRGKEYFICHGGISNLPNLFVSADQLINGTGKYEELETTYESWMKNTPDNVIMIHGHRNVFNIPAKVNDRIYNLCDEIEFGGNLRIAEITESGVEVKLIPNTVFDEALRPVETDIEHLKTKTDNELLRQLNQSNLVRKKLLNGGIVSYNFTRDAFYDRKWNELTCTARGLFVDNATEKVICRSYSKFFNWDEVEATRTEALKKNLVFPVYAYKKENGFLAMVSYNWNDDELLICSKSTNSGDYVGMISEAVDKLGKLAKDAIKAYVKENNCTLVFECVNIEKDPHIIRYDGNHLYLLDIIKNSFATERTQFEEIKAVAGALGLECKELSYIFNTFDELNAFKKEQDRSLDIRYEGWVFEDSNGFMVKYKTRFYKFWKMMRAIKYDMEQGHRLKKNFNTEDDVRVYNVMKDLYMEGRLEKLSILDIQDIYYSKHD